MRRSSSTCASALLGLALLLVPRLAAAQACCASPSGFAPTRLQPNEDALVGLVASASAVTGSWGADRSFRAPSEGSREVDLSQRLVIGWAPWSRAELSLSLPLVETIRQAGGASDVGGGLGDVRVGSRWTLSQLGTTKGVPRIQVLSSLVLPTGVAADAAHRPLATDATGVGVVQWENGLALEQAFGPVFVSLSGTIALRGARDVRGVSTRLGPLFATFAAVGWSLGRGVSVGATVGYEASLAAAQEGESVDGSATARSTVGVSAAFPLGRGLRLTLGASWTPHVEGLGQNEPTAFGGTMGVVWAWGRPSSCPMHPTTPDCGCPPH